MVSHCVGRDRCTGPNSTLLAAAAATGGPSRLSLRLFTSQRKRFRVGVITCPAAPTRCCERWRLARRRCDPGAGYPRAAEWVEPTYIRPALRSIACAIRVLSMIPSLTRNRSLDSTGGKIADIESSRTGVREGVLDSVLDFAARSKSLRAVLQRRQSRQFAGHYLMARVGIEPTTPRLQVTSLQVV